MTDRDAFLAAIHAAPDDDAPRLVYSDWLEEHGQPERAEFIRLQLDMWREYDSHRRITARLDDLFVRQKALFIQPWADVLRRCGAGAVSTYSRGFSTDAFSFRADTFVREAPELAGWFGPEARVTLHRCAGLLADVAALPELRWVHDLVLCAGSQQPAYGLSRQPQPLQPDLTDDDLAAFCQSPHLGRLAGLNVASTFRAPHPVTARACVALATAPTLTGLRSLELTGSLIGDEGVAILARADNLRTLQSLVLDGTGLTGAVVPHLVGSPVFAGLTRLSLLGGEFTAAEQVRLEARFGPALHLRP